MFGHRDGLRRRDKDRDGNTNRNRLKDGNREGQG